MLRVSALYPNVRGSQFDSAYYVGSHTALAKQLLTPHGLTVIRATIGLESLDGMPPPFWAISEMHFTDRAAFDAAMTACGVALFNDASNYTDVSPILQLIRLAEGDE